MLCPSCVVHHAVNFLACVRSRGHIYSPIIIKIGQNFFLIKSRMSLKIGYVMSKTRLLGQILEKHCVCSRSHIFSPIVMKVIQDVCLDEFSDKLENGSCRVKNYVTWSNLSKTLCTLQRPQFQSYYHETWSCWVKNYVTWSNLSKTLCTLQRPQFQSYYRETWSCWVKNYVTWSYLSKTLCTLQRPQFQSYYHETWLECLS